MIRALVIDDEPLARSIILDYLEEYPQVDVLGECGDGFEAAKTIMTQQPDLIFLDVQMPKINGFEMLELLDQRPAVIFTTAFDEYAIRAFEQHAVDYLLKPISKLRFDKAMQKYLAQKQLQPDNKNTQNLLEDVTSNTSSRLERVVVKTGNTIKIIPVDDILYLEADDDYVKIHTENGSYLKNKTMAYFERELDSKQFVRLHRSYIVRIDLIARLEPYEKDSHIAILTNGTRINVSKTGYSKLKAVLGI
ncbi:LytR/AlgR family response regulator transcription factor [Olivibacter sitiensis]|uniref:LytR/AlgR family response regulator transcription factor n=1 Tax=Olivibacter sitiensis TaxID=376470 RepID=UPI0004214CDF|nr:LytTR family transcriptional regulator DNA-binding domain-containing protein [Olivibacter sitiensis]